MAFLYLTLGFYWLTTFVGFVSGRFEPTATTIGAAMFCTSLSFFTFFFNEKNKEKK